MKKGIHRLLPWAVLMVCFAFSVGVYALIGEYNLNADISSEMVLADLLNREGALLSGDGGADCFGAKNIPARNEPGF